MIKLSGFYIKYKESLCRTMKFNPQCVFKIGVLVLIFVFNTSTLMAVAFPFREFEVGDTVPDVTLKGFRDSTKEVSFSELRGKPFVAVFWGADIEEKRERSAKTLKGLEELSSFLAERQIKVVSANVQVDEPAVIEEVINEADSNFDVYVDENRNAYASLGIFIMPTILLVDKDGKVVAGMGFSHDVVQRLRGEIEIMLGEKNREQVMAELRPEMKEPTEEEKASRRHMDFGLVMRKRGQIEASIRELKKAVEINPKLTKAHFELGCIYLEKGELEEAEDAFDTALESDPDSLRGRICKTKYKREKGLTEEAIKDLQFILQEYPDAYDALYTLGLSYEDLNKPQKAMEAYRKAYLAIEKYVASQEEEK